jgi:formylglycine-generating enzyme required for sulfatase activity
MIMLFSVMMACLTGLYAQNHAPEVKNVRFSQRSDGTLKVDIYYDLNDADYDSMWVTMQVSENDGADWNYACPAASGDVNKKLTSGMQKHIVWDFFNDHPHVAGESFKFKITAVDEQRPTWEWIHIPAGEYAYGPGKDLLPMTYSYDIMKYPVTNADYIAFLQSALAAGRISLQGNKVIAQYPGDEKWSAGAYVLYYLGERLAYNVGLIAYNGQTFVLAPDARFMNHPVVAVTWFGAWAFADYYGMRLPKEQEWEKAARGDSFWVYPWGNKIDGTRANFFRSGDPFDEGTTPVGYYNGARHDGFQTKDSPSYFGLYDMAGNVWQWTGSFYGEEAPLQRVFRGGGWAYSIIDAFMTFYRTSYIPENRSYNIGFRCVKDR